MGNKKVVSQPIDGELLPAEIQEVVKDLPPETAQKIIGMTSSIRASVWSGPLPPPDVFKQYPKEVQKAVIDQANAQMKHRQKIEDKVVTSNIKNSGRGMTLAFWLTIAMIAAGTILVALGQSTAGLVAIFGTSGFQGGNYLFQKWREMQQVGHKSKKQNNKHIASGNEE